MVVVPVGDQKRVVGLQEFLQPVVQRAQEVRLGDGGPAEQPERLGAEMPLHDAEFATVAQAFEAREEAAQPGGFRFGAEQIALAHGFGPRRRVEPAVERADIDFGDDRVVREDRLGPAGMALERDLPAPRGFVQVTRRARDLRAFHQQKLTVRRRGEGFGQECFGDVQVAGLAMVARDICQGAIAAWKAVRHEDPAGEAGVGAGAALDELRAPRE